MPVFPVVVIDVVPDCVPPIVNPNTPSPPIVFFIKMMRAESGVEVPLPFGHSVEKVGIGQPIPESKLHLTNGPMPAVPLPDVPPVIAPAIAAPSP